jgi:hypothetical protein
MGIPSAKNKKPLCHNKQQIYIFTSNKKTGSIQRQLQLQQPTKKAADNQQRQPQQQKTNNKGAQHRTKTPKTHTPNKQCRVGFM